MEKAKQACTNSQAKPEEHIAQISLLDYCGGGHAEEITANTWTSGIAMRPELSALQIAPKQTDNTAGICRGLLHDSAGNPHGSKTNNAAITLAFTSILTNHAKGAQLYRTRRGFLKDLNHRAGQAKLQGRWGPKSTKRRRLPETCSGRYIPQEALAKLARGHGLQDEPGNQLQMCPGGESIETKGARTVFD